MCSVNLAALLPTAGSFSWPLVSLGSKEITLIGGMENGCIVLIVGQQTVYNAVS